MNGELFDLIGRPSSIRKRDWMIALNKRGLNRNPDRETQMFRDIVTKCRSRAANRSLSWSLPKDDAVSIVRSSCVYCGLTPAKGIDRIDSALGYETGNVQACCWTCNRAKSDLPTDKFAVWLKRLSYYQVSGMRLL